MGYDWNKAANKILSCLDRDDSEIIKAWQQEQVKEAEARGKAHAEVWSFGGNAFLTIIALTVATLLVTNFSGCVNEQEIRYAVVRELESSYSIKNEACKQTATDAIGALHICEKRL